jgi:hypothetical protein
MQKSRVVVAALLPRLVIALFGAFVFTAGFANSDSSPPSPAEAGASTSTCDPDNIVVYQADEAPEPNPACGSGTDVVTADRDYLVETATPGATMVRQGPGLAIGRLHPEFVRRLAAAIREARGAGLASAGIFSAYRPPAFGVGGFSNKFNSLHTYGLAVDMAGIGGPGSAEAKLWYEIAARNGVTCPYGFENRVEWNHCQPTRIRIVLPENRLRDTVTANGPVDLDSMFEAGNALIESPERVADAAATATIREQSGAGENGNGLAHARVDRARTDRAELPAEGPGCKHPQHASRDACGRVVASARPHARQASTNAARHHT